MCFMYTEFIAARTDACSVGLLSKLVVANTARRSVLNAECLCFLVLDSSACLGTNWLCLDCRKLGHLRE